MRARRRTKNEWENTFSDQQASAVLYSVVECAKANGFLPYNYLTYLFEQFCVDQFNSPINMDIKRKRKLSR